MNKSASITHCFACPPFKRLCGAWGISARVLATGAPIPGASHDWIVILARASRARCVAYTTIAGDPGYRRLLRIAQVALFVEERANVLRQFGSQEFDPYRFRIRTRNLVGGRNFCRFGVHHFSPLSTRVGASAPTRGPMQVAVLYKTRLRPAAFRRVCCGNFLMLYRSVSFLLETLPNNSTRNPKRAWSFVKSSLKFFVSIYPISTALQQLFLLVMPGNRPQRPGPWASDDALQYHFNVHSIHITIAGNQR